MRPFRPSRRAILIATLAAAGGLTVGFHLPSAMAQRPKKAKGRSESPPVRAFEVNAWIVIATNGDVVIRVAHSEMGQGVLTGLAQLAAEELDCNWSDVRTELVSPAASLARNRVWGDFATSNSRTVRSTQATIREAGAAARAMLVDAAATAWNVPTSEVETEAGTIRHTASGRSETYGRIAEAAARLPLPPRAAVRLKPMDQWRIAGTALPSLDAAAKVTGAAVYGIDVRLPGMLNAAILAAPSHGGKLASYDPTVAEKMPGVRRVMIVGDDAIAAVAETWWQAHQALAAVPIVWAPSIYEGIGSESIRAYLRTGLESNEAFVGRTHGDSLAALRTASQTLESVYTTPFLHHATLEPMNATALVMPDRVEVWAPTQNAEAALLAAADAAGLPPAQAIVHRTMIGGGFGRRIKQDFVRRAVQVAKEMPGIPVKLIWSREEDTIHGHYRPITQARIRGGLDDKGEPTGLIMRISGQSILTSNLPRESSGQPGRDPRMFQGLYAQPQEAQMGYSIPNVYIDHAMRNTHVPVGSWRGVHTTQNGVYLECFIDEMALAARRDPLEFRTNLMKGHPRHLAVLISATAKAGWDLPAAPGVHRGLAQMMAVGSYAAVVAEVTVSPEFAVKVVRVVIALDCGTVVNPRLVEGQMQGAVAMAVSATLFEEITIDRGRVVEQNFDTYQVLRMVDMPKVECILVPSGGFFGGVGEAAIGAVAPAVLNAVFAATGKRIRTLPLKVADLR